MQYVTSAIAGGLGVLLAVAGSLAAPPANAPLPPRRPPEVASPKPPPSPELSEGAGRPAPAGDDAETCAAVLAAGNIVAEREPPIQAGVCGIQNPVILKAVILPDKHQVGFEPPAEMRCLLASAVATWVVEDIAPAFAEAGQPLVAFTGVGAYQCRARNGVAGAQLSQHATGNALDVAGFRLADQHIISIQRQDNPALLARIRESACARFSTVLGPGADVSHKSHLHVDLQERKHGMKICQWDPAPLPAAEFGRKETLIACPHV